MFSFVYRKFAGESPATSFVDRLNQQWDAQTEPVVPDVLCAQRFYQDTLWTRQSHTSRRDILQEALTAGEYKKNWDESFVIHLRRSLALDGHVNHLPFDPNFKREMQAFLAQEKFIADDLQREASSHLADGDVQAACKLYLEACSLLQQTHGKQSREAMEPCRRVFFALLSAGNTKQALDVFWAYPGMLSATRGITDDLASKAQEALNSKDIAANEKLALNNVLRQLGVQAEVITANDDDSWEARVRRKQLPEDVRKKAEKHLNDLNRSSGEDRYRIEKWLETVVDFPFETVYGPQEDVKVSIQRVRTAMDSKVMGHKVAKEKILDFVFQRSAFPQSCSNIIGLQGAPGNGKSTLLNCLEDGLQIPVCKVSLNGMANSGLLFGIPRGIVGVGPGRLVQDMIRLQCAAPIFLFEEVDKVSKDQGGVDIVHKLMALTDSLNHRHIVDDFLEGVRLSCSRSLLVFTFNDASKIDPILRSRMQIIETEKFSARDKKLIFNRHMLPKVAESYGLTFDTLKFSRPARDMLLHKFDGEGKMKNLELELNAILVRAARLRTPERLGDVVRVAVEAKRDGQEEVVLLPGGGSQRA